LHPRKAAERLGVFSPCLLARKALCALLASKKDFNIALELDSALANAELVRKSHPDVSLVNAVDPGFDLKDVSLLQKLVPEAKVVLSAHEVNEQFEVQAIRAGAWGGVSRRSHPEVLEKALRVVAQGDLWVSHHTATRLIGKSVRHGEVEDERADSLTHRERESSVSSLMVAVTKKLLCAFQFRRTPSETISSPSSRSLEFPVGWEQPCVTIMPANKAMEGLE